MTSSISHRVCVVSLVAIFGLLDARAASSQDAIETLLPRVSLAAAETATFQAQPSMRPDARPTPLVQLYVSLAALQVLDVASTRMALRAGGIEANPIVQSFAGAPLAFVAVKGGAAAAMIYASERLWKKNRKAAVLTMIGLNAAYGAVVAHNYGVAGQRR
jgi:hypothetical protein